MKRLITLLAVMMLGIASMAQIGVVKTFDTDTIQGNEYVTFGPVTITGTYESLVIQALCTQLGGTSDGTLILQASVDGTSYNTVTESNFADFYPNDTLTITNKAIWSAVLKGAPYKYYKVYGDGTPSDTTKVTIKYILK